VHALHAPERGVIEAQARKVDLALGAQAIADGVAQRPGLLVDLLQHEGVEAALLSSIQQQAANPQGPYQPADLALLVKKVLGDNKSLYDAVSEVDEAARERQAQEMPAGSPETMPGLAMLGMGAEAPVAGPPAGGGGIEALLAQLGG